MFTIQKNEPRYIGLKVTNEEYIQLEDDGFRYDMIEGVLHLAPSPFSPHNADLFEFSRLVGNYLFDTQIGIIIPEVDVHLPDGGDVLRPDVSIVLKENKHIIKNWIFGTPDIVCEVLSESTKKKDLNEKADRYLTNGVKEYWIIEPTEKWMEVWYNKKDFWEKHKEEVLSSEVLKGFLIDTKNFFKDIWEK